MSHLLMSLLEDLAALEMNMNYFSSFFYFQLFKNRVQKGNLHLRTQKSQTQTFHIWGCFVTSGLTHFYNTTLMKIVLWNTSSFIYSHGQVVSREQSLSQENELISKT